MEILGFLILVIWAVPMFVSMACDRNSPATLGTTMASNAGSVGLLFLSDWLYSHGYVVLGFVVLALIPVFYVGLWTLSSETFGGHLLHMLRLGPKPKVKRSKPRRRR